MAFHSVAFISLPFHLEPPSSREHCYIFGEVLQQQQSNRSSCQTAAHRMVAQAAQRCWLALRACFRNVCKLPVPTCRPRASSPAPTAPISINLLPPWTVADSHPAVQGACAAAAAVIHCHNANLCDRIESRCKQSGWQTQQLHHVTLPLPLLSPHLMSTSPRCPVD